MYFDNLQAALSMNGHGIFVWSAYALTALVLLFVLWLPQRRQRRLLQQMAGEHKRQPQPRNSSSEGR